MDIDEFDERNQHFRENAVSCEAVLLTGFSYFIAENRLFVRFVTDNTIVWIFVTLGDVRVDVQFRSKYFDINLDQRFKINLGAPIILKNHYIYCLRKKQLLNNRPRNSSNEMKIKFKKRKCQKYFNINLKKKSRSTF